MLKKSILTAKHAKKAQSTQSNMQKTYSLRSLRKASPSIWLFR